MTDCNDTREDETQTDLERIAARAQRANPGVKVIAVEDLPHRPRMSSVLAVAALMSMGFELPPRRGGP
jgi:hypothetical protein